MSLTTEVQAQYWESHTHWNEALRQTLGALVVEFERLWGRAMGPEAVVPKVSGRAGLPSTPLA